MIPVDDRLMFVFCLLVLLGFALGNIFESLRATYELQRFRRKYESSEEYKLFLDRHLRYQAWLDSQPAESDKG